MFGQKYLLRLKKIMSDADERNLVRNILLAFLVKGISLFVSLFSMPLYIKYFDDNAALGMWYTILSMLSWINLCDLGLGNGLRNRLTEALALRQYEKAKEYISATYTVLCRIILPISVAICILLQFINFNNFFNISNSIVDGRIIKVAMTILVLGVCINFIVKVITNVIYALQKSSLNNVLALISSILPLIFISVFKGQDVSSNLVLLSIVHIISINLPLIVVSIILFNSEPLNKCKPSFKNVSKEATNDTLILGMHFFLAQTFFMLLMQTNEIIITNLFSPDYVVEYSIYYKLFTAIGSLFMLALTPMWSKVTKDFTERKYQKIKKTHRLLSFVALLACALELLVVPFLQIIVNIWLQEDAIIIDDKVAILFAVYGGLYIFNVVLTTIANGIGEVRSQMVFYGIGAILKLPVIFMSRNIGLHWSAVVAYTSIILLLFCVYQFIWLNKKIEKLLA
ncbi:MAG: hypothetical protein E7665_02480 [Ruminococcaceae bacterium]|nr:hypothetical protein [Oscillospiraceae bacterium]